MIISPDEINFNLQTIVIAPITKTSKKYPTRVNVINNNTTSWIAIDQIRTIDKSRVLKNLGQLSKEKISEIKFVIKETFVD